VIAIVAGIVGSLFASDAWNDFTYAAGETANPKIILQLNLFFNTLLVNLFYIFFNPPYLLVLPFQQNPNGSTFSSMRFQFCNGRQSGQSCSLYVFKGGEETFYLKGYQI